MRRMIRLVAAITLLVFSPRIIAGILEHNTGWVAEVYLLAAFVVFAGLLGATIEDGLDRQ